MRRAWLLWCLRGAILVALAGLAVAYGRELVGRRAELSAKTWRPAGLWQPAHLQAQRHASFLARIAPFVPPGARVIFHSPDEAGQGAFFSFLWASYRLPDREWMTPDLSPPEDPAPFVVAYQVEWTDLRYEPMHRDPLGAVYRLRSGGSAAP
jgi:hypothetical protein